MRRRAVIIQLTARLVALPDRAWSEVAARTERGEELPSPAGHAATAASLSVLATLIGAARDPGRSVGGVVMDGLTAIVGYGGVAVFAALLLPSILPGQDPPAGVGDDVAARFAASAALPLCLSGIFNFHPNAGLLLASFAMGALLSLRAAWCGSASLLGLTGRPRARAAIQLALFSALPLVAAALYRAFFTR